MMALLCSLSRVGNELQQIYFLLQQVVPSCFNGVGVTVFLRSLSAVVFFAFVIFLSAVTTYLCTLCCQRHLKPAEMLIKMYWIKRALFEMNPSFPKYQ